MRNISDDDFKAIDPLSISGGLNPYGDGDQSVSIMFKLGPTFYRTYIQKKTGFTGGARVLDLLSGFGMWSMFLAEQNGEVHGIDIVPGCKTYGEALAKFLEIDNVSLITGDASETRRFADGFFDYAWMYSAMQYVNRGAVLGEVHRVLRPGGRLFVGNYNSEGLMLDHLMKGVEANAIHAGASGWGLGALAAGPEGDGQPNYGTVDTIGSVCQRHGFRLIAAAPQGGMNLSLPGGLVPNFKPVKKYEHYDVVIDFVAEKT
jgi:SAM-dependent methyltransferase